MFRKILIANRGEIALRVIRACREMGISTVAVHSEADRDSLHVKLADESVCIGPAPSRQSYLSIPQVLSAAEITNADAIHPGYGFLAENAEFANVCEKCGVKFIGPTSAQIDLMGDKISAREAMKKAGLPMLPSVQIEGGDSESAMSAVSAMGLPVIIKAAAGGGGKGIKIVRSMDQFLQTVQTAQAEAKAAFGDATVYVEKYLEHARHIEFQVVADEHGNVIHLGERDCSIQRRYQKIIEESPSVGVTEEIRKKMGQKIVAAISKVGYQNVGTIEFLMDPARNFYFLEMNTRIQVEHPITEEVTGIDLVKLQIQIAAGQTLPYKQEDIVFRGHAMEFRINAEDPKKFFPSVGRIKGFHLPGGPGVRLDHGVYDGFFVPPYYDSLLGKLIVRGKNREEVLNRASTALHEFYVGGIQTNIPLHQEILRDQKFRVGDIHIRYLDNFLESQK